MTFRSAVLFLCLICGFSAKSQQNASLTIIAKDNPKILKRIDYDKSYNSPLQKEQILKKVLLTCYDNAYLLAQYDSVVTDSISTMAYLNFGTQYQWATVTNGNIDEGVLSEVRFREKLYANRPLYFKDMQEVQERLITYYENNGYPFASTKLDSITINDSTISGKLYVTKNQQVKIDSIIIKGTAKITPVYIYNYLGIKPNSLYDESKVKKINTRMDELQFVTTTSPAVVKFTNTSNTIILYLDDKRASQFDGIVGILPDDETGKTLFTGDVHLQLQNGLHKGELIDINWRRLQTQTQDLKTRLVYPFLFKTPFGIDYTFKLYKKDTTFLDVTNNIGLQYLLSGNSYFKVFYENKTSTLLSTEGLSTTTIIPNVLDINANRYGAGVNLEKLDYRLNPRKGYELTMNGSVGTKEIKKNAGVNEIIYDSLELNSTQYTGDFKGSIYIPIPNRSTFKIGVQSAFIYGATLFQNELFRIGGLKSLRGFDEESIFASSYAIATLEYRFLLEQNSYLFVFGNGAYYENNSINSYVDDFPFGFGAGISFQTKAGVFSINYALGKQFDNPILLREGKIHFGVVNYF